RGKKICDDLQERATIPQPSNSKWKPETLLDFLLAKDEHQDLLAFFGGKEAHFQPSEAHVEKMIPDRIFWSKNQLHTLELKVEVDSRACAQVCLQRALAISHYIEHASFIPSYTSKFNAAIQNVKTLMLSVFHPSEHFESLLNKEQIEIYSIENGIASQVPLDYSKAPLPLVLADLRAKLTISLDKDDQSFLQYLDSLSRRQYTPEEKLFLQRYQVLLKFPKLPQNWQIMLKPLQEVTDVTESDLKQIVKDKLYLLSPEERLHGLSPEEIVRVLSLEERLHGLSAEERKKLLKLLQQEDEE
ncbi:MAG: hypothetical protein ACFFBD_23945, partial [Candidatus Hodarchaeota archaeon]